MLLAASTLQTVSFSPKMEFIFFLVQTPNKVPFKQIPQNDTGARQSTKSSSTLSQP